MFRSIFKQMIDFFCTSDITILNTFKGGESYEKNDKTHNDTFFGFVALFLFCRLWREI